MIAALIASRDQTKTPFHDLRDKLSDLTKISDAVPFGDGFTTKQTAERQMIHAHYPQSYGGQIDDLIREGIQRHPHNVEDAWRYVGERVGYHQIRVCMMAAQMDRAAAGKMQFLDVLMSNGKKLRDCTGDEVVKMATDLEALEKRTAMEEAGGAKD